MGVSAADGDDTGASFGFAAGFVEGDGRAEGSRRGAKGGNVEPVLGPRHGTTEHKETTKGLKGPINFQMDIATGFDVIIFHVEICTKRTLVDWLAYHTSRTRSQERRL